MSNKYNPKEVEDKYYKLCEDRGYFEIDGNKSIQKEGKNFSIMMPPPNVTGSLHIGHALTFTLQDIITRYKRMDGYKTLWQPGTDHAGIATQNVVEKQLLAEGTTKEELGREKFLERAWLQKETSGGNIVHQMRKLGVTPAWKRERFTLDSGLHEAVKEAFVSLYNDGQITQNTYMVNWCTHDGALSDIEVEHEEVQGKFYTMIYKFADGSGQLEVATTRPETYFGDTAIMVHPDDKRYTDIVGKEVLLPLTDRKIKVITDTHVDMEFGTGVVKVTPAHDQNDYAVGKRHNLEFIKVFNEKGILNDYCGEFAGLERLEARPVIVKALQNAGYIVKIEEHIHQVGHCYRCKNIVEPFISTQWFLSNEMAQNSIDKTKAHNNFHPPHWINSYTAWMDELRPWCISRQLWWGHRIPVFTCDTESCGHQWADKADEPECCPKCSSKSFTQDPDVLDTWFSSALWAMSPLGWGNNGELKELYNDTDMEDFYPNSLLITGFDIMFFWVARMMMMGEHFQGELPFKDIYMHALVRDETGAKMSKSKGNVIDPLDMVEEHSADIIRFTLAYLAVQGRDIKLGEKNLEQFRNFTNKLYNATNFLQLNVDTFPDLKDIEIKTPLGKYMQSRLSIAVEGVRETLETYKFNDSARILYNFVWNEFCDWGIEYSKANKEAIIELGAIFKETLKMVSPFMPFIADHLYHKLSGTIIEEGKSLMIMEFPSQIKRDEEIESMFEIIEEAITSLRRAKVVIDMGNSKIEKAYIKLDVNERTNVAHAKLDLLKPFIQRLAKIENLEFVIKKQENSITDVSDNLEVYLPRGEIDLAPIISKLTKQKEKLEKEIAKVSGMLSNERFVANAPEVVIAENKKGLDEASNKLAKIEAELLTLI
ncbi:MAG: valine--tRNA ligase [Arcobacteraceae bacterium]|nr:valine--tRNA ligase [Arcobacteraceae bacterium]